MTQVDRTTFKANTVSLYADNTTGNIGANDLRAQMNDIADSTVFKVTGQTAAPTANDDNLNTAGNGSFGVGDVWVDTTSDKAYICLDSSTNVAIWRELGINTSSLVTALGTPTTNRLAIWNTSREIRSDSSLTWNGTTLAIVGQLTTTGNVNGRNMIADGVKLDLLSADAITAITVSEIKADGSSSTGDGGVKTINFITGDGLVVTPASGANTAEVRISNNEVTNDAVSRTLGALDNNSFITNAGALGTVRWTVPASNTLATQPRLVATFIKVANQTMEIAGSTSITINGVTELGGNESLITICPTPYTSMAQLVYAGTPNTYYVYETNIQKTGTTANNQVAIWTGNGTIEGNANFTWDGTTADVTGEVKYNWTFEPQVGLTYTLVLADRGRIVTMDNASPNTLTIPAELAVDFPIGTEIRVIQIGAGATSIAGDTGVTLNGVSAGTGAMTGQWDEVRLYKAAADTWYATGDIGVVA